MWGKKKFSVSTMPGDFKGRVFLKKNYGGLYTGLE
jgi:hypothetical protein